MKPQRSPTDADIYIYIDYLAGEGSTRATATTATTTATTTTNTTTNTTTTTTTTTMVDEMEQLS
jgi:hypothetical protein